MTPANPLIPPQNGMMNPLMPPGPPPPPSPSLGFSLWAQDPQNAMKVMPSMTAPDKPLQPNAGGQMAATNPPPTAMQLALTPPGGFKQAVQQTQANVNAQPSPDAAAPLSMPSNPMTPPPMASAAPPRVQNQTQTDQAELQRLQQNGAGVNKVKNPFLRTLGKVADVAGTILAPGVAAAIPGTTVHNWQLQNQQMGRVAQDQSAQAAVNQQQTDQANLAHTQAETAAIPINAGIKQQAASASLAQHGLKVQVDENGMTHVVPDEDSPVYQQQQQKEETLKAQADYMRSGIELRQAQAALAAAKNDPNSPAFKQAQQRLVTAQGNMAAAQTRATAYMGRYLQSAYNTDAQGNVLPGATTIANDNGDQTVVGTGNAPLAVKNQGNAAQFNDVHGALDNLETTAKALVAKGGSLNSPGVAAALAQPAGTLGQWMQGAGVKANLTPEERQYVMSVAAAHENVQALRKSAGGTATDSAVAKLDSMIPGVSTPDLNYLLGQTGQIRQTAERLGKGASTAAGGLTVRGQQGNHMTPPKVSYKQTATGPFGKIGTNDGNTWFDVKTGKKVE